MTRLSRLLLAAALLGPVACASPSEATREGLLQVESVDVLVSLSFPPQVSAAVTGVVPTPCTAIGRVEQRREGNTITVTIATETREVVCIQIIARVTHTVRLEGSFPSGDYVLRVNGVERRFQI